LGDFGAYLGRSRRPAHPGLLQLSVEPLRRQAGGREPRREFGDDAVEADDLEREPVGTSTAGRATGLAGRGRSAEGTRVGHMAILVGRTVRGLSTHT
jgi:hypothetical protein